MSLKKNIIVQDQAAEGMDIFEHKFVRKSLRKGNVSLGKKSEEVKSVVDSVETQDKEEKEEEKKIKKELLEIYENEDGTMPDMKEFKKRQGSGLLRAFLTLLFSCLFLGAVAWAGFFFWQPKTGFAEDEVTLSITGDNKITIGQDVEYRVMYRNNQNIPLSKVSLQVRYPAGFVFVSSSIAATNDTHDEWILGSINNQSSGYIDIRGKIYGNLNEQQSFRFFLNYVPANFSSEFQKVASFDLNMINSPLQMIIQSPTGATLGLPVIYQVTLHNKTSQELKNIALILQPGDLFNKTSSTPKTDLNNQDRWTISSLVDDQVFLIRGVYKAVSSTASSSLNFKVVITKDGKDDNEYVLEEQVLPLNLVANDLNINLAVNGSVGDAQVQPGDILNGSIMLKNSGTVDLTNAELQLIVDAPAYNNRSIMDWTKLDDPNDGTITGQKQSEEIRRGSIVWNSEKVANLGNLKPGDEVNFDWHLPIRSSLDLNLTQFIANNIVITAQVKYTNNGEVKTITSNPINLLINSDLNLQTKDEVSLDATGRETHRIFWLLTNSFHELKNLELQADLYGDFDWNQGDLKVPLGKANFDSQKKIITWNIDDLPINKNNETLQFSVTLNNKNSTQTSLASKVKITADDMVTGQKITKTGEEVLLN